MLRAADYKDNDKILTLLTAERGRISAGIKGVKKAGARLKFAAQPFCFAEYILAERGGRYTVTQASECESFYELRSDVNKFYAACAVCETAMALTYEGDLCAELFSDCIKTLSDMCSGGEGFALVRFLLSVLKKTGYGVSPDVCSACGAELIAADRLRFDMDSGSFGCWDCGKGVGVSAGTYSALRAASGFSGGSVTDEGVKRALKLLKEYLAYKTEAKCLSLTEYIRLL